MISIHECKPAALNVAHVVLSLDFGGMERVVLELVREGFRRGQRPSVICLMRKGTLASQVEALGAEVVCLDKPDGLRFEMIGRIREALRRLRPDVVHTHQIGALLYAGPAARREGVPAVVHTEHIDNVAKAIGIAKKMRVRAVWSVAGRYAGRFVCVSDDIAGSVVRNSAVARKKVFVVPNGIDTEAFTDGTAADALRGSLGIPLGAQVIGSIGRLNEVKRQDLLIRSFADVSGRAPQAHLLLVGDGPEMASLRQLAKELAVADRVHFAGYQSRPQDYLQVMDVFALTSRLEGMPLVILEAWAASRPVVASQVGGVGRLIEHDRTGFLFGSGDQAALTDGLDALLSDRSYARRLAELGRLRVCAEFDTRVMAGAYEAIYRELLPKGVAI